MLSPHKISVDEIEGFLAKCYVECASATTADKTRRKRFGRSGTGLYLVERCDLAERIDILCPQIRWVLEEVGGWHPVYCGTDIVEAVRRYNEMN